MAPKLSLRQKRQKDIHANEDLEKVVPYNHLTEDFEKAACIAADEN